MRRQIHADSTSRILSEAHNREVVEAGGWRGGSRRYDRGGGPDTLNPTSRAAILHYPGRRICAGSKNRGVSKQVLAIQCEDLSVHQIARANLTPGRYLITAPATTANISSTRDPELRRI